MLLYTMSISQHYERKKGLKKVLITQTFPSAWYFPYIQYSCFNSYVKKNKQLKENLKI